MKTELKDIFFGTLTTIKNNEKDKEKELQHRGLTGIIFVYEHGRNTFDILMYEVLQDDDGITFGDNLTILGGLLFISEDEKQMLIADKSSRYLIDLQQKLTDDSTEGLPDRMRLMHAASRLILRLLPPGSILIPDHDTYKEVYDRGFQDGRRDMLEEVALQSNTEPTDKPLPF